MTGVLADLKESYATGKAHRLPDPAPGPAYVRDQRGMNAAVLMTMNIPPLRWAIADMLPAGLGILASPPKTGKSLFCYQTAVALATGTDLLGHKVERRHVRYYALEDGERRSRERVAALGLTGDWLEVYWDAPTLGETGGLEDEVENYLSAHPDGVIIIDVLSKVRPAGGKGNAYDEDYNVLKALKALCRTYPDAVILLVTHDRKAGSDDWVTRITGTRGVTGSVDFTLFIDRKRGEPLGRIHLTGRDMADDVQTVKLVGAQWEVATFNDVMASPVMSETRLRIYDWVKDHGPALPKAVSDATGLDPAAVRNRIRDMTKDGQLAKTKDGYVIGETPDWYVQ